MISENILIEISKLSEIMKQMALKLGEHDEKFNEIGKRLQRIEMNEMNMERDISALKARLSPPRSRAGSPAMSEVPMQHKETYDGESGDVADELERNAKSPVVSRKMLDSIYEEEVLNALTYSRRDLDTIPKASRPNVLFKDDSDFVTSCGTSEEGKALTRKEKRKALKKLEREKKAKDIRRRSDPNPKKEEKDFDPNPPKKSADKDEAKQKMKQKRPRFSLSGGKYPDDPGDSSSSDSSSDSDSDYRRMIQRDSEESSDDGAVENIFSTVLKGKGSRKPRVPARGVNQVLVMEKEVSEEKKFKYMSLQLFQKSIELLDEYKNTHEGYRNLKLVHLYSRELLVRMYEYNKSNRLKSVAKIHNSNSMFTLSDKAVVKVVCDYMRPKTKEDYIKKLYSNLKLDHTKMVYTVKDYHKYLYAAYNKMWMDIDVYDRFLRLDATVEQLALLPQYEWGASTTYGAYKVFLAATGDHESNIKQLVTEEVLKKKDLTRKHFFKLMKDLNKEMSDKARDLGLVHNKLELESKPADILKKVVTRSAQTQSGSKPEVKTDIVKKKPFIPFKKKATLNVMDDDEDGSKSEASQDKDDEESVIGDVFSDIEQQLEYEETLRMERLSMKGELNYIKHPGPNGPGKFSALTKNQPGMVTRKQELTPAEKSKLVCFEMKKTGQCTKGSACLYNHNTETVRKAVEEDFKKLADNPFLSQSVKKGATALAQSFYIKPKESAVQVMSGKSDLLAMFLNEKPEYKKAYNAFISKAKNPDQEKEEASEQSED